MAAATATAAAPSHFPVRYSQTIKPAANGPSPTDNYPYAYAPKGIYTTTTAVSPTSNTPPSAGSPTTTFHAPPVVRHIRQPRQPMYIPAALRPPEFPVSRATDIPQPRAPDTPPSSSEESSYDASRRKSPVSGSPTSQSAASNNKQKRRTDSRNSVGEFSSTSSSVSDASTLDSASWSQLRKGLSRAASDSLDLEPCEVTGPPTSAHWKPDAAAAACGVCQTAFSWFLRRHHCRRCGDVICATHSSAAVPLDQHARFNPAGLPSRACDPCAREWRLLMHLRSARPSLAERRGSDDSSATAPALPIPGNDSRAAEEARVGSMARSEGGMVWSTF